ncbi:unnamed protein product [Porites lobata]|uniref:G domain-containing protein n=1 Tax=Porites lobata TaxID=104759 RepID=A0ABN8QK35_9CNID|nr:unnamed protein product [Porites lobata]
MIEIQRAERERERREREREKERGREKLEHEERQRIEKERRKEEETKRAEYERQRNLEKAREEERRRKEEEKRMRLEKELYFVTQLRIGVFGATGSGKSCFINTCERTVRQTEKGSAPDSSTGQEGTITLQDYLPELFFRLVDTRGFFNYNAYEIEEFQNILHGKIQP